MNSRDLRIERLGWASVLLLLLMAVLWSGNFIALKIALKTVPPIWSAFWRMVSGSAVVVLWAWSQGVRLHPTVGERGPLLNLGLMFTVQIALLNIGQDLTSPAYSAILLNSHAIFANVISHFSIPGDRLSRRRVTGLLIAFAGICVVFLGYPTARLAVNPAAGNLAIILSASILAVRTVYTKRLVHYVDPVLAVVWQGLVSLPVFLLIGIFTEPFVKQPLNWGACVALLYQGVVIAGFCYVIWTKLIKRHSPGVLSTYGLSVPVFGVVFSALAFGENITLRLLVGMVAVAIGLLIVTREPDQQTRGSKGPGPGGIVQ